ncbi:hypothetical protein ACOMHN_019740 [Nucella lapillus]
MISRGSQTDFSLICKDGDDSMHSKDSIENNSTPERNNGARSSEGNVSEDILRSGTRPRDGVNGSSGDGAENTHVADNVSAPVPVNAPKASVEEIEEGPNTFHTDQHAEAIDALECDSGSDTDDLHNASFESIAGSVTSDYGMILDDLSSQNSSFSIVRNVGEDSAFHVGHRQRSPFWSPGMGHPRTSLRPFHQAQGLNPTSLRAISASHVYRNGSPAYRGNIMLSQCPTSLYSHPAPAPPPPAYTLNPSQYTVIPDELPPAYSLTDPLVSQTAMLVAQTSSVVSSDQQALPTRAENGADLDCTTRSEQDPENVGTESTPSVDGQTRHSSERHFSATEVAEEESLPPSSGTYQDSERQNLSSAGTDLPTSISDTADIAEDEDQREVFSEQPGTSSDTDSLSPPRGYPETRGVSQLAEKFFSSSLDGDIDQSGFSHGCSSRRTASGRKPSKADTAQSQPSQATTVPDSTDIRDGQRVSSTAVRADAGQESEQASARPETSRRDRSRRRRSSFVFPIPFLNGPVYGQTFTEHMNCVAGRFGLQDQGPLSSDDSTQLETDEE